MRALVIVLAVIIASGTILAQGPAQLSDAGYQQSRGPYSAPNPLTSR